MGGAEPEAKDEAMAPGVDPGVVPLRRLTRREYNNTVRDLLGTTLRPADSFIEDSATAGFDNVSASQSLTLVSLQLYQDAAEALADDALLPGPGGSPNPRRQRIVTCDPATGGDTCLESIFSAFAARAWRRPPDAAAVRGLVDLVRAERAAGGSWDEAMGTGVQAVLLSPPSVFC